MTTKRYPTKIIRPHYPHVFKREHLFKLLEQHQAIPLIWVNGAPGAGKTVSVASFLEKKQACFLWYRMDVNEKIEDIFYFLTLAASRNYPRKKFNLPVFTSEYGGDVERFARIYFRQLFACLHRESAIVLDNCQEAEQDKVFYQLLLIAVNELPQDMQLICISRNSPDTTLYRLRLNNELLEVGKSELMFNYQESQAFLKWLNPQLADHHIRQVQSKSKGWVAGMVLLTEQLNTSSVSEDLEIDENIFGYLISEILSHIDMEYHEFLLKSALFTQMTAEMAIELTGFKQAKFYLDNLVTRNFLVERTGGSKPAYSYHPLFRECLLDQAEKLFSDKDWRNVQQQAAMILVKQNRTIEAMALFQKVQDWPELKGLLLQQADELIKTGRHHAVSQWVEALPTKELDTDGWLNYWYGQSLKPVSPLLAAENLEKSYHQFILDKDVRGIYSAWEATVESISISMDDFSRLEPWEKRFDEIRKNYPSCPSIQLKVQFYVTAVQAFSFYNPQHPWLRGLIKISEGILRIAPVKIVKEMLSIQLGHYYTLTCQLTKLQVLVPYLQSALINTKLPALPRIMGAFLLSMQKQYLADEDEALAYLQQGLKLTEESGIHVFKSLLLTHIISCHICKGDLDGAENALQEAINSGNDQQRMLVALHYSYTAWLAVLRKNKSYALEQNEQSLLLTKSIKLEVGYVCSLALKAQILAEMGQWQKAEQTLSVLSSTAKNSINTFNRTQYYLSEAWLAYLQHDQDRILSAIEPLLQMLKAEQILFFFYWRSELMSPLCIFSIENGIEEEFAVRMLKINRLFAKPPIYLEKWPWPIRIYSFGSLRIEVEGELLEQTRKSQKKILEFLAAIVTLGGRKVACHQLGRILWPDTDGDLVKKSLETALHRLRQLIGKEAVLCESNLISLNDSFCWLDVWAFEEIAKELEQLVNNNGAHLLIVKLTDRLLKLHQEALLSKTDFGFAQLKQEQLQSIFCHQLDIVASFHEQRQENERACLLLKKGLEQEPYLEACYLRLMNHYISREQPDQAHYIYQKCQRALYEGLGIPLSNKIQSLAKQLQLS